MPARSLAALLADPAVNGVLGAEWSVRAGLLRRLIDRPRLARKLRDHADAPGAPPPPSAGRRPRARARKPGP
jgi:hypothetical protein